MLVLEHVSILVLKALLKHKCLVHQSSFNDHRAELQKDEKMRPPKYWKDHQSVYPFLDEVAITVLGILASSVLIEKPVQYSRKSF